MSDTTTIQVEELTADKLYKMKGRSATYNDVISELLNTVENESSE